ncbi:MAG: biopolymer transporter ExbD [Verrucomicrobiota bacterium]
MKFYTKQRRSPTINIVSLVDILCILLIFFVVTTVFKADEPVIKLDLPKSAQGKPIDPDAPIIIYVTETEKVYLGDVPIETAKLGDALQKLHKELPNSKFALKSSKKAPFGLIVQVMDAVKSAGIDQLPAYTQEATETPE